MPDRETARGSAGLTRPRCSELRSPTPTDRWKSCARCIPSILAWPAPFTSFERTAALTTERSWLAERGIYVMAILINPAFSAGPLARDPERIVPVYVWELPVRLAHWGLVIALVVLTITGSYMHDPYLVTHGE